MDSNLKYIRFYRCTNMRFYLYFILLLVMASALQTVLAASIINSKHNLGTTGPFASGSGNGKSDEVCVFCHTPHSANIDLDNDGQADGIHKAPLWNRRITDATVYLTYTSPTMNAVCDATPSPVSLACLSCHDGVTGSISAVDNNDTHSLVNPSNRSSSESQQAAGAYCDSCHDGPGAGAGNTPPATSWQIGADLRDDHPISMRYEVALEADPSLNTPPDIEKGWSDVKLINGRVECPSCHNPHDPTNVPFLRKSINGSGLCLVCHNK